MSIFWNGLATGLVLQLAVGPVFFFIINLALQKTIADGLAGALAVTAVDYFYITLSILGIGRLLEHTKAKRVFGIISSIVLIIFGMMIMNSLASGNTSVAVDTKSTSLFSSFASVFLLTISSPMTIVFFTSLFTTKAVAYSYKENELVIFGVGVGLATLVFMSTSVMIFSFIKGTIPILLIHTLNVIVGFLLIGYGGTRLVKIIKSSL